MTSIWEFIISPIHRGPSLGSMLMCMSTAWVGCFAFISKRSLLGEALSHASYPGIVIIALFTSVFFKGSDFSTHIDIWVQIGGAISAGIAILCINYLQHQLKIKEDAALCFILTAFFAVSIVLISYLQLTHTSLYREIQAYLYGQSATMNDLHILFYAIQCLFFIVLIALFYKNIQLVLFDREHAKSLGVRIKYIDSLIAALLIFSVVSGMRSVGLILISSMLIAPPVAARKLTQSLKKMLIIAGLFGALSGLLGSYLSYQLSIWIFKNYHTKISFPTGPSIVMVITTICFLVLLLSPREGFLVKIIRMYIFRSKCIKENLLKFLWKKTGGKTGLNFKNLYTSQPQNRFYLRGILALLSNEGCIYKSATTQTFHLTSYGIKRAAYIVRLHRLWELYLVNYLDIGAERVHKSAEEIEHILTPEIEEKLTEILHNPGEDPHHQPIPKKEI